MNLIKFEQSGFIFETNEGFRLALDIGSKTPLSKLAAVRCDAMLVSHIHSDHFSPEHIKALLPKKLYLNQECQDALTETVPSCEILTIKEGDTINVGGITVLVFSVDHGPNANPLKENLGFLLTTDNQTIYFAGDMFYPSGIDVSSLEVDKALLPVGTYYTFGPEEAVDFAKQFKRIGNTVPMHYEKDPQTREQFVALAQQAGLRTETAPL